MSKPVAQLIITLMEDGSTSVNGPIANVPMCYGMLEVAKDAIRDHAVKAKIERQIVPVEGSILEKLKARG